MNKDTKSSSTRETRPAQKPATERATANPPRERSHQETAREGQRRVRDAGLFLLVLLLGAMPALAHDDAAASEDAEPAWRCTAVFGPHLEVLEISCEPIKPPEEDERGACILQSGECIGPVPREWCCEHIGQARFLGPGTKCLPDQCKLPPPTLFPGIE